MEESGKVGNVLLIGNQTLSGLGVGGLLFRFAIYHLECYTAGRQRTGHTLGPYTAEMKTGLSAFCVGADKKMGL